MTNLLENYTALAHSATIYVPSTQGTSGAATNYQIAVTVSYVCQAMSTMFGGYTVTEGTGGWYSDEEGELVQEKVTLIRSNAETMTEAQTNKLVAIAKTVKRAHEQEAVSLEVDGKLYFI